MDGVEMLGWGATAVFVSSYFFRKPATLRRVQVLGALLWVVYGVLLPAAPVIAANLLVVAAAAWTARRAGREMMAGASRYTDGDVSPRPGRS